MTFCSAGITPRLVRLGTLFPQLQDRKGLGDVAPLDPAPLPTYAGLCAWMLASAHTCGGDRRAIAGYLGGKDVVARLSSIRGSPISRLPMATRTSVTSLWRKRLTASAGSQSNAARSVSAW